MVLIILPVVLRADAGAYSCAQPYRLCWLPRGARHRVPASGWGVGRGHFCAAEAFFADGFFAAVLVVFVVLEVAAVFVALVAVFVVDFVVLVDFEVLVVLAADFFCAGSEAFASV